jgi:hypothetical protein
VSLQWVVDKQHFSHKSHLVMHVCVFQDPCAPGNLLVVCQSKLFHSSVGVVWDVGTECFHVFHVGFGEDFCVEGRLLVGHIENNLKWLVVLMRVRSKRSDPKRLVVFY